MARFLYNGGLLIKKLIELVFFRASIYKVYLMLMYLKKRKKKLNRSVAKRTAPNRNEHEA